MLITPIPTREVCKLLKTGQVTSYVDYDDGYFQKGVAKEYLVLTDEQFDGTTDIVLNEKTDVHSNNCVLDLKTGLMWSRYVSASVGPESDGKLPWTTNENGEGIFPYCVAANVALLAEYGDWRVCNKAEFESLYDFTAGIDTVAFPDFPALLLWISTTRKALDTQALQIRHSTNPYLNFSAKTDTFNVLLVRGG